MALILIAVRTTTSGAIMKLCQDRRGIQKELKYLTTRRASLITYDMPLTEVVLDFYDKLKTVTRGYGVPGLRFRRLPGGRPGEAGHPGERRAGGCALPDRPPRTGLPPGPRPGRASCSEVIPRQLFEVAIQAAIGSKIIARETVSAMRKNVLAKCYGGDITRKRKLLEKQKEGKKRMKKIGRVDIPQEAFLALLKLE